MRSQNNDDNQSPFYRSYNTYKISSLEKLGCLTQIYTVKKNHSELARWINLHTSVPVCVFLFVLWNGIVTSSDQTHTALSGTLKVV